MAPIEETLADLQKEYEATYKSVTQRIDNNDNKSFKITSSEDASVVIDHLAEEEIMNNPFLY